MCPLPIAPSVVKTNPLLSLLFLNNNLHFAHHKYPQLAWYRLPEVYRSEADQYRGRKTADTVSGDTARSPENTCSGPRSQCRIRMFDAALRLTQHSSLYQTASAARAARLRSWTSR